MYETLAYLLMLMFVNITLFASNICLLNTIYCKLVCEYEWLPIVMFQNLSTCTKFI